MEIHVVNASVRTRLGINGRDPMVKQTCARFRGSDQLVLSRVHIDSPNSEMREFGRLAAKRLTDRAVIATLVSFICVHIEEMDFLTNDAVKASRPVERSRTNGGTRDNP